GRTEAKREGGRGRKEGCWLKRLWWDCATHCCVSTARAPFPCQGHLRGGQDSYLATCVLRVPYSRSPGHKKGVVAYGVRGRVGVRVTSACKSVVRVFFLVFPPPRLTRSGAVV
ncbi:unnamed protein product, partial [Laminaria digitata]